jgi:hypothetical protein
MPAGIDLKVLEELTHGGVTLILLVGIVFLWRAWQAEREANSAYTREFIGHVAEMNQIPEALDRLRTDVLTELRELRRAH